MAEGLTSDSIMHFRRHMEGAEVENGAGQPGGLTCTTPGKNTEIRRAANDTWLQRCTTAELGGLESRMSRRSDSLRAGWASE
jgi:hypothetical protein